MVGVTATQECVSVTGEAEALFTTLHNAPYLWFPYALLLELASERPCLPDQHTQTKDPGGHWESGNETKWALAQAQSPPFPHWVLSSLKTVILRWCVTHVCNLSSQGAEAGG